MSDTTTPRTDSLMEEWHHCPPTKQLLNHSRQLERELVEANRNARRAFSEIESTRETLNAVLEGATKQAIELTAHKAALEKCEEALGDHGTFCATNLRYGDSCDCYVDASKIEALSEIAKLKGNQ